MPHFPGHPEDIRVKVLGPVLDPQQPLDSVVEDLIRNAGLSWMLPTLRALIQQESGNNPYVIHTGKNYTKQVEKLLSRLEEETGTVWTLNPLGESTSPNELSVGIWQYNLHGGMGEDLIPGLGQPSLATDENLVQAIATLSDTVLVSIHALEHISGLVQFYQTKGLTPGDVAEQSLGRWSARFRALEAYTPTSFEDAYTETSIMPSRDSYLTAAEWEAAVINVAGTMVLAGRGLPDDADEYFKLQYEAAQVLWKDEQPTPEQKAKAKLELQQMELGLRTGELGLRLGEQDLRLGEPAGFEKIIRTESGQRGYRDYWAGDPISAQFKDDTDYLAGYKYAQAEERPGLADAAAKQMDRIISQIGNEIESKQLLTTQLSAEFNRHLSAFEEGGRQFISALPYAVSPGRTYLPSYEPGGFAESLGLQPQKFTPIQFDPYQMALDIVGSTQPITSAGVPEFDPVPPDAFNVALALHRSLF